MGLALGLPGRRGAATVAPTPHRRLLFVALGAGLVAAVIGGAAAIADEPLIYPSLGPTAFLLIAQPANPVNSPWSVVAGHASGLVSGYLALVAFGLTDAGGALSVGVSGPRIGAIGASVALTAALLLGVRSLHAPACATTLIVSLGLLPRPRQHIVMLGAVVLIVVVAAAIRATERRLLPARGR